MKKLVNPQIGIDQGEVVLFADFETDGEMWTGSGPREARKKVTFSDRFRSPPSVQASITLWDVDKAASLRAEISVDHITETGCEIVFRTWLDTRIARLRAGWIAIGELSNDDDWELY